MDKIEIKYLRDENYELEIDNSVLKIQVIQLERELRGYKSIKIANKHPEQEVTPELLQERINYLEEKLTTPTNL